MRYSYNAQQLDAAVEFVYKNNKYGYTKQYIYNSIIKTMEDYYDDKETKFISTLGYLVLFYQSDDDEVECTITVDPGVNIETEYYITVENGKFKREYV